ncbi:MAG: alpha/beta fold hydrolase [bacterium]
MTIPAAGPFESYVNPDLGVLEIHGYTGSADEFSYLNQILDREGISYYALLLPGHGTVVTDLNNVSVADLITAVDEAYQKIASKCKKVIICATSAGCCLSLHLLVNKKIKVVGVIWLAPWFKIKNSFAFYLKFINPVVAIFRDTLPKIYQRKVKMNPGLHPYYEVLPAKGLQRVKALLKIKTLLKKVKANILLMYSTKEYIVSEHVGEFVQKNINSAAQLQSVVLDSKYHVFIKHDGKEVALQKIVEFIKSCK